MGAGLDGGTLFLVDHDRLWPGNIGRHALAPRHLGRPKAEACTTSLKADYPWARITAITLPAMEKQELLESAELVVDATGEEAVSYAVNAVLVARRPGGPDALHVWLVGQGAAAQALFVTHSSTVACLRCLRPDMSRPPDHWPLAVGSALAVVPAACGEGEFVPYGVAAPAMAAGLAAGMCLEWARGGVMPALRTVRLDLAVTGAVADCTPPPAPSCPACSALALRGTPP